MLNDPFSLETHGNIYIIRLSHRHSWGYKQLHTLFTQLAQRLGGDSARHRLYDLRRLDTLDLDATAVRHLAHIYIHGSLSQGSGASAIVADTDLAYGMARMWLAMAHGAQRAIAVFRRWDQAWSWLGRPDLADRGRSGGRS